MRFQPASYLTFCLSVSLVLFVVQGIDGRSASCTTVEAAAQKVETIPIPGMKAFPESTTSTTDGTLYVGRAGDGGIVRTKPRTAESTIFIQPGASGSRSILGVFADEASSTLWACSNDLSALGGPATSNERFCNVFKFRDDRISSLHIYLDPDYTGEDEARFRWGKNRKS
jgi:hypothetical protein